MSTAGTVIKIVSANVNASLCTPCGGKCCSHMPGTIYPIDISPNLDRDEIFIKVHDLLQTGRWAVDQWDGDPEMEDDWDGVTTGFYLRPATKGKEGKWFDASWGGDCTFHSSRGCELSVIERPTDCRTLVPHESDCYQPEGWSKHSGVAAWYPFRHILEDLLQYEP